MKPAAKAMGYTEMVVFIAACMALNALSIDVMLPALPEVNRFYALNDPNTAQAVIAIYLLGMGSSQLVYGPLSDRFGRRPVLIGGLLVFALAGLISSLADSFATLLAARFLQGVGAGAPRVIAVSMARDNYAGVQMGKVMSLVMMIFMTVPILAPGLGQLILLVAPWRWAFGSLVVAGGLVLLWALLRMEESLPVERRRSIALSSIFEGYKIALTSRITLGCMLALGMVMGAQMGFITSAQQIFVDVFHIGHYFPLFFALVAVAMAVAAFINSRLVERLGMRFLTLAALTTLIILNLFHTLVMLFGLESLAVFLVLQSGSMFFFGMLASNLNSMAMEPMGEVAGTASSLIGFFSTSAGALIGFVIGQSFDGSPLPLALSYMLLGLPALLIVYLSERRQPEICC